ncbi:hypothetical protein ACFL7E_05555 [Thermodesulfobacteriota bacterium]
MNKNNNGHITYRSKESFPDIRVWICPKEKNKIIKAEVTTPDLYLSLRQTHIKQNRIEEQINESNNGINSSR